MKNIEKLKSHFAFTRGEQYGILILSLCIFALQLVKWYWREPMQHAFNLDSQEVRALQKEMDSLRCVALEASNPKMYPFNPNFISDYKGYVLGLSPEAMDCLFEYKESGRWIRTASEFQKITGVSNTWLDSISPYFKFPQLSSGRKIEPKNSMVYTNKGSIFDLNKVTSEDLRRVPGIGEVYSKRIVKFREQLGGFSGKAQLYAVYGLDERTIEKLFDFFTIQTPVPIEKKNINDLSASDIATLPGISFDLAKSIWEFIRDENGIESLDDLRKIDEITPQKIALIQLYLSASQIASE